MLRQIQCDAFVDKQPIVFGLGLNIIQGYSGNSIGKTSLLKIVDYAFGGTYYSHSNKDIIKYIGHHTIKFTHIFNGKEYNFSRYTGRPNTVCVCNDEFNIIETITLNAFNKKLSELYGLSNIEDSFRAAAGLYLRVWSKPNREVKRPLFLHNTQQTQDAILGLVKLFEMYSEIQENTEQINYLKKRKKAILEASRYNIVLLPKTKEERDKIVKRIDEIDLEITRINARFAEIDAQKLSSLSVREGELYENRQEMKAQLTFLTREIQRIDKTIYEMKQVKPTTFSALQDFFPNVNVERLEKINDFHQLIRGNLVAELEDERRALNDRIALLESDFISNEKEIEKISGLPQETGTLLQLLNKLNEERSRLVERRDLYNDRKKSNDDVKLIEKMLESNWKEISETIEERINNKIIEYSQYIQTSNDKPPHFSLSQNEYTYGVEDNTGTGKAYTDLLLFDLAVLSLTRLPVLLHDSFLFNNIDPETIKSLIKIYNSFGDKQIFIALDNYYGEPKEIADIVNNSMRFYLSNERLLFGVDWRNESSET